jgi:hypothetical protein
MGTQYYGCTQRMTEEEAQRRLSRLGIDYYLVWRGDDQPPGVTVPAPLLEHCKEVAAGRFPELRIFALRRGKESPDTGSRMPDAGPR